MKKEEKIRQMRFCCKAQCGLNQLEQAKQIMAFLLNLRELIEPHKGERERESRHNYTGDTSESDFTAK